MALLSRPQSLCQGGTCSAVAFARGPGPSKPDRIGFQTCLSIEHVACYGAVLGPLLEAGADRLSGKLFHFLRAAASVSKPGFAVAQLQNRFCRVWTRILSCPRRNRRRESEHPHIHSGGLLG